jgi:hypothetical protein
VRGSDGEDKDLAASKDPLLPCVPMGPQGSDPQQRAKITGRYVLAPFILKGNQIERLAGFGRHGAYFRKIWTPPRQQRYSARPSPVKEGTELDR